MLRSRESTRQPQAQPRNQWSWERFCREEAKESASAFLERVRRFKSRHVTARDVHDSTFTNEFSAAFLEESSLLMASGGDGELLSALLATNENTLTTSLPAGSHANRDSANRKDTNNNRTMGGKSWWSGLLEWSKSKRAKEMPSNSSNVSCTNSSRLNAGVCNRQRKRNIRILKETASVQLLDLNEQEDKDEMSWSHCKLVLVEQQDHYQIEIYSPPKSQMPKMSLFCFLIEEVRPTSRLEIPDSESCFVVKSPNHRECVFDVRTSALMHEWVALIQAHSKKAPTANGISRSTGLSSCQPALPQAPQDPPVSSSHISASQPNTPILTLQSSPLLVTRAHRAHNNNLSGAIASSSTKTSRNRLENVCLNRVHPTELERRKEPIQRQVSMPERKVSSTLSVMDRNSSKDGQESVFVDIGSFMRNYSVNSNFNRQHKTTSMLMDPSMQVAAPPENPYSPPLHPVNLLLMSPHTAAVTEDSTNLGQIASGKSPSDSPPPLPKREYKQRNLTGKYKPIRKSVPFPGSTVLNKTAHTLLPGELPPSLIVNHTSANVEVEKNKSVCAKWNLSQPVLESLASSSHLNVGSTQDLPSPGTLETCSQSTSSSALHPISMSALITHDRVSLPTSPVGEINPGLLSMHPTEIVDGDGGAWPNGTDRIRKIGAPAATHWSMAGIGCSHTISKASPNLTPAASLSLRTIVPGLGPTLVGSCSHIAEVAEDEKEEGPGREGKTKPNSTKREPLSVKLERGGKGAVGDGSEGAVGGEKAVDGGGEGAGGREKGEGAVGGGGVGTVGGEMAVGGSGEDAVGGSGEGALGGGSEGAVGGDSEKDVGGGGEGIGRDVETASTSPPTLKLETRSRGIITISSPDERQKANMARSRGACSPTSDLINKVDISNRIGGEFRRGISTQLHNLRRGAEEEEERGNHATLTFPYQTQHHNPTKFQIATGSTRDSSVEAITELRSDSPLEATCFIPESSMRTVDPHTPTLISASSNLPAGRDGASSCNSNHTNFSIHSTSSSSDTRMESSANNPIFVETTGDQGYGQVTMHTSHPYEYWATNQQDITNLRELSQFPWFHGMISRNNASQLVLVDQESGTGQFLVRQSESREGNFVLTFNYHNRAKHLRMAVDCEGCQVQHLTFASVPAMLDHFKSNSIPLESFWLNDDVKLTTYIDRCASDNFRTTTVVNLDQLNRVPPRRTRSLHLGMSHSVMNATTMATGIQRGIEHRVERGSTNSSSMNSLLQNRTTATGWRQIFSQRSSSAGNVGRVHRSNSQNAGSLESTGWTAEGSVQPSSSENAYVWKNY